MTSSDITAETSGVRIDVFLAEKLPEVSRSGAQKLIDAGLVTLGGKPVRKNHRTEPGPVSYTHLDVYKRQTLSRRIRILPGVLSTF